jgi:hypothetical protein
MNNYDDIKKETVEHFKRIHGNFAKLFNTDDFYIAGGAIRDFVDGFQDPKDYDIFVTSEVEFFNILNKLTENGYKITKERENSKVLDKDGDCRFDIIKVEVGEFEPMHDFDLVCCTAQFGPFGLNHHANFFKDVIEKEININNFKKPYLTYKRIAKHIRKGFTVEPKVLVDVMNYAVQDLAETEAIESSGE